MSPASTPIADRLHSVAIHLLRRVRAEDRATGVPPAQLSALSVLVFGGPMRLERLARIEQVRPPTMSRIVAALVAAGLVTRAPDPEDGRALRLAATVRGARLMRKGRERRVAALARELDGLTGDEAAALRAAVAALEKMLERGRAAVRPPAAPRT